MMRQSRFELLRILCMMGVLVGHILLFLYPSQIHSQDWSLMNQCRVFLLNACAVAVNCFVMISGYFTISFSWGRVLRFCGMCLWYAFFIWLCLDRTWSGESFWSYFSELWFVPCYLALMLVSPLLNQVNPKPISLLLLADEVLGYWMQNPAISSDGYNLFHLMVMYCLGISIARKDWYLPHVGVWCIACFVLMTLLHAVKMVWNPIAVVYSLHYNAPMMILASVLVLLWAKNLKIQSRGINWVAASVFSVYLILSNPIVVPYLHQWIMQILEVTDSSAGGGILLAMLILCLFAACILVDKVRIAVFCQISRLSGWLR